MRGSSAQKMKLTSYDDLFGGDGQASGEAVTSVPIRELHPFKGHPFRVLDDEKMQETVESVKKYGILVPGIVRSCPGGGYEVVSGHRRWRACELAGLDEMPVIIRELDDDESTVIMVDSNIQREDILPSEKAKAYKMKYEALRHQGSKGVKSTADEVGEAAGESGRTVQRYIRLAELIQGLIGYVDGNKISLAAGEKLSYLRKEEQAWVSETMGASGMALSMAQPESACEGLDGPGDMQGEAAGEQEDTALQEEGTWTAGPTDSQSEKSRQGDAAECQDSGNQKSRILKIKIQQFPESKENEPKNSSGSSLETENADFQEGETGLEGDAGHRDSGNQKSRILKIKNQQLPESKPQSFENQNSGVLKIESQEFRFSKPNNTDSNDTDFSETEPIYPNLINPSSGSSVCHSDAVDKMAMCREMIRDRISYGHFTYDGKHLGEEVDELVELVVDVMMMPDNSTLRIAGAERPVAVVKERFMKLEQAHIEYVIRCLQKNASKIENIKAYLLTTLYNATMTIENYYRAEVNYDMYGRQPG